MEQAVRLGGAQAALARTIGLELDASGRHHRSSAVRCRRRTEKERLTKMTDVAALADEMYLSVLTRYPDATEKADVAAYLKDRTADRPAALQEMVWGLLSSTEFRFNH